MYAQILNNNITILYYFIIRSTNKKPLSILHKVISHLTTKKAINALFLELTFKDKCKGFSLTCTNIKGKQNYLNPQPPERMRQLQT